MPHIAKASSYSVSIHIAGDPATARHICRKFCDKVGLCVTVTDTDYIYTNGSEVGVRVGLINYPRFPKSPAEIEETAFKLASMLRNGLRQESFTIETPNETMWFSWREQDVAK
ncbi:hypothetical protein HJA82_29445 [Rhizobium bangladeshense]|nr:hypothetical protein [Rhizobium bangladeshense]